jgi:thiol-disulfide isomerase/thioredoxin
MFWRLLPWTHLSVALALGFLARETLAAPTLPPVQGSRPGSPATPPAAKTEPAGADPAAAGELGRLSALLINGGGSAEQNYQSHLLHIEELTQALLRRGLPPSRISIFASDGADPGADLAIRAVQPELDFWHLQGTGIEGYLRTPIELTSSRLQSLPLQPATEPALRAWFAGGRGRGNGTERGTGSLLRSGDTLLLYVTDHGTRNDKDPRNNRISLWGRSADLTVDELGALLSRLDPGVRVVAVMSQCYSGGFARLYETRPVVGGRGGFCGYFSSTADRPAYGCYPENRDKDNVGYSFHIFEELARGHSLPAAHREVLTTDRTPDVPLRTSDVYLQDLLARAAAEAGEPAPRLTDRLLSEAWKDRKTWEPDIRLLDRVSKTFGMWSPRSLAELEEQAGSLPAFSQSIAELHTAWSDGQKDLNVGRLGRLIESNPSWRARLDPDRLERLRETERRQLTAELLAALASFDLRRDRLLAVHERSELLATLEYRMEVRTAALLRLRGLLASVAGRVYLSRPGREKERQRYLDLLACEDLPLPAEPDPRPMPAAPPQPFPAFAEDVTAVESLVPTYMGIRFESVAPRQQRQHHLPAGAAVIRMVYPDSPAEKAGLLPGDVILGPPGKPFTLPNEVRVWTYFASAGKPQPLEVLRGARQQQVILVPQRRPDRLPTLPEPPREGIPAPALSLTPFRGVVPSRLDVGSPHLLFFWGTYCGPCKASLPEVLAFSRARGVPVVAITDEPSATVGGFFSGWKRPFPANVALDELRRTFIAYGVNGVPTFVLVDGQGKVTSHRTGYDAGKGLGIPGWQMSR